MLPAPQPQWKWSMEKSFSPAAVPAASVWKLPLICLLCEGFWMASAPLRPWSSFSPSLLPDGWLSQSAVLLPPGSVPFSQHLVLPPHNSSGAAALYHGHQPAATGSVPTPWLHSQVRSAGFPDPEAYPPVSGNASVDHRHMPSV